LKHSELTHLTLSRTLAKYRLLFKTEGAGDFTVLHDFSAEEAIERIRELDARVKMIKHNDEGETHALSGIVIFVQNLLYLMANRSMGPFLNLVKTVFPNLVGHHEDVLAVAVIKKYQKMAMRVIDEQPIGLHDKIPNNSPGKKLKTNNSPGFHHSKTLNEKKLNMLSQASLHSGGDSSPFLQQSDLVKKNSAQFHSMFSEQVSELSALIRYMHKLIHYVQRKQN